MFFIERSMLSGNKKFKDHADPSAGVSNERRK